MSEYTEQYRRKISSLFDAVAADEGGRIAEASALMGETIIADKLIHVIGTGGHSNIGAYEMFWRAGGLVPVNAILDPGTLLENGALRSGRIERLPGYGVSVLEAYGVDDGVLIIVNGYGINAMTIDVALEARRRGVQTIGVTSKSFGESVPKGHPARHPSGRNLYELVDVFVDTKMPYGDAIVEYEGLAQKVGPSSTLVNCFAIDLLVVETVRYLMERGFEPPLWKSANVPGGDEANAKYQERYRHRLRHLG